MITTPMREDFAALAAVESLYQPLQGRRIYVTGASGQIGWYLVHFLCFLIAGGHLRCELTAHLRNPRRLQEKFPEHASLPCRFAVDEDAATALAAADFDLVLHCASRASPKHFAGSPVDVLTPNAILTQALLEQLRRRNPACRFVYLSTTGVTGFIPDEQRPSSESEYGPLSCTELGNCYLESKRFGEMLCLAYQQQYGIPVLILRPSITYGPGFELDDGRSYADFVRALLAGEPIRLTSDGSAVRNFLYVADFVRGLLVALAKAAPGTVLNVASPAPISILELATLLNARALSRPLGQVERQTSPAQAMTRVNFKSTDASVDQLRALGWEMTIDPLAGFQRTIRHYQECIQ
jgi:dTDP-glucose 4,6-dehydratase